MNLHTGLPLWFQLPGSTLATPTASGDLECEVLIVGGGITGALIGYYLTRQGVDTILLDRRQPGEGSTSASTGLLQYEIDTPLVDLIESQGEAAAVQAYRRGVVAIDELEALLSDLGSTCGFTRRPSLYFASNRWHSRHLRREYDCRKKFGFDVDFLSAEQLAERSTIVAPGAILSQGDAEINPLELTRRLFIRAQANGLRAYSGAHIDEWRESSDGIEVTTLSARVRARKIVLATGYEVQELLHWTPGKLHSTYALASQPIADFSGWPDGSLIWETARPYFYARQTSDGRAIIGGGDTSFAEDHAARGVMTKKADMLVKRFGELFPQIRLTPACIWAGTFAETSDGLAYIGRVPERENVFAALGYGGNGITFAVISARLICDLCLGQPNADESVFSFAR